VLFYLIFYEDAGDTGRFDFERGEAPDHSHLIETSIGRWRPSRLWPKQLGLLRDLVPKAATIAALLDRIVRSGPSPALRDARDAAAALGQKLLVLEAGTAEEIEGQFARLDQEPADAMLVITTPFFVTRAGQIAALAARHRIPAIYARREFAEVGGLMSYGFNVAEVIPRVGALCRPHS
jgi:putative ABC transport system substrate-binding protein